jgi:hypothetical protein
MREEDVTADRLAAYSDAVFAVIVTITDPRASASLFEKPFSGTNDDADVAETAG